MVTAATEKKKKKKFPQNNIVKRRKRLSFTVEKTSAPREFPLLNSKHVRSWLLNPDPQHCPTKASLYGRSVEATMTRLNDPQNISS